MDDIDIIPPSDDWTVSVRDQMLGLTHLDAPRGWPQPDLTGQFSE